MLCREPNGPYLVVQAESYPMSLEDLQSEFRAGVTAWVKKNSSGRSSYAYAGNDMNFGDLADGDIEEILKECPNINTLKVVSVERPANWMYDTPICDEIEGNITTTKRIIVKLVIEHPIDVDPGDVISDMDYGFNSNIEGTDIVDERITDVIE